MPRVGHPWRKHFCDARFIVMEVDTSMMIILVMSWTQVWLSWFCHKFVMNENPWQKMRPTMTNTYHHGSVFFVVLRVASYWIDTLVLKNWGKYLRYSAASSLPLWGKPTQAQDVARRISGAVAGESTQKFNIPSTHHNPYLSHYIICHLPLVFLSLQFTVAILF